MNRQISRLPQAIFVIVVAATFIFFGSDCLSQEKTPVRLNVNLGDPVGGNCSPERVGPDYFAITLAGSMLRVNVSVLPKENSFWPTLKQTPFDSSWPAGLIIEAGFWGTEGIVYSADMVERMNPFYFTKGEQRYADSLLRSGDENGLEHSVLWNRYFALTIPDDLAGDTIKFHVQWTIEGIGTAQGWSFPLIVITPCSDADQERLLGNHILVNTDAERYGEALILADSLIQRGWADPHGLDGARTSAAQTGDYQKAMQYNDLMYSRHGFAFPPDFRGQASQPEWISYQQEEYERLQQEYWEKIEQQR